MTTTISPTHTCFDDALDFLTGMARAKNLDLWKYSVVHGIVVPIGSGVGEHAHAWLEHTDGTVVQAGMVDGRKIYYGLTPRQFRKQFFVKRCTKYTVSGALLHNQASGNYGPWEAEYQALCRDTRPVGDMVGN